MPTRCAVPTCYNNNYKNNEHKFYSFPRDRSRQKLWVQMIGRVDINVEKDISKNYSICDIHFHPLMIENGRLKEYALPILLVSWDSLISSMQSVETQTCYLSIACSTQTESVQLKDKNVQTNNTESFETAKNSDI
ncbi:unnamed protein product [Leptidea sinapis]|uniref:THAP-type domain-containing protein n=1 Tax=Leptidea sinapis TaxID=189913 RepID=A0A5E4Q8F6_9NEOP|nr:unnamed protein product [Leptidea sinapis]